MIHLTGQNLAPREVIQNIFSPMVGAIISPQAEELCQKNNLSFVEMLQPFLRLSSDAHFRDTAGTSVSIKGLRINVCDINWRPPQTILAKKMLNDSVNSAVGEKLKTIKLDDGANLDIPASEPWFEQWRETFLTVQFPSDHEFTRHLLCSLIVVSSIDVNPLEVAGQLTKKIQMMQSITPPRLPKWFSTDSLNCYVMLHDGCSGDIGKAQQAFEGLKSTYGDHQCFLLQINTHQGPPMECPDPWLRYLRKHQRSEAASTELDSTPKTPQDMGFVTSMPTTVQTASLTPGGSSTASDSFLGSGIVSGEVITHPLSPVQETGVEIQETSSLTSSIDSLSQQTINPNVWTVEGDVDIAHGTFLTAGDLENLKHFVQDLAVRALIPYVEKLVGILNDSISNKKGVSRSLLSATKRWFVTNKPGTNTNQNAVVYTNESTELQTRKLGDLYFMFGHYYLAFQSYHQAKRDFNADSAWQYYAGALEMAALAAFMQGTANRKTYDYMEEAIVTYLSSCKMPQFATRATLLSMECLKAAKLYNEAAKQLIRMTSEDSDLRSAVLLEQAAYCYLLSNPPQYRKYAFHSVLSGHRYSKAGQRKHSFRTYKQAYQVFENRGWSLAEDHIQYTIGRQAINLKKLDEASNCLAHLLRPSSLQSAAQQAFFLKDFLATQKALLTKGEINDIPTISLPKIVQCMTRVLVISPPPVANPLLIPAMNITITSNLNEENVWNKMEEMLIQSASKKSIMIFKATKSLFTQESPATENPRSVNGEPIEVAVVLENAIKPPIVFECIHILWEFRTETQKIYSNKPLFMRDVGTEERKEIDSIVTTTSVASVSFGEYESKTISLKITPRCNGQLRILGVVGKISSNSASGTTDAPNLWGKQLFEALPIRTNAKENRPVQFDRRLEIEVLPPAPALHVSFSPCPVEVLAGEIIPIKFNMTNAGVNVLSDIYICVDNPRYALINPDESELPLSILRDLRNLSNENLGREKEARKQYVFKAFKNGIDSINPNETKISTIWLQAPYSKGLKNIKILIYYGMPPEYQKLKYRLVRHTWSFNVNESLLLDANCNISNPLTNELGIDLNMKNLNQVHHPLMTEITIHDIVLYCSSYEVNDKKIIYIKNPGYQKHFVENVGLKTNGTLSLRCNLQKRPSDVMFEGDAGEYIYNKLSTIVIRAPTADMIKRLPNYNSMGSFLMKTETKYIRVYENTNNEEFNQIISTHDRHMTLCVSWSALINDNGSSRMAYGRHFVQLRNLYDSIFCPPSERHQQVIFTHNEIVYNIFDDLDILLPRDDSEKDEWGVNNSFVAQRCFLEENLLLAKA
ncbi:trafficking protein particle complex subunit 8 [Toxorhynchites rutilus septentrionalis]|uniref:trafficking protein particle complex subunit 8 n=1 Tax=Toxorhynchites rutilus septentrionalis TaxID=329112 RepID=UPI0024787C21|nr:trafficking protein particle complex subunit 8 [Toxorhynchites rutilus septentrionalis]XP_055625699.1 trafficking protein particle complex subunit 8 [Toxorhynchites rutilus septentrionalis]XP_055625700.1 trafficking protein particle complex subunit 8 [Toxorhynchites rutilus septentrionalis]